MRADALQMMLVHAADSENIGPIITKLTGAGYPEDLRSLDLLTSEEREDILAGPQEASRS